VPRPDAAARADADGPRLAAGAVADALTTALMMMPADAVDALCAASPGLEAWLLVPPSADEASAPELIHLGGPATRNAERGTRN
jgi:hypothetical protein